MVKIIKEAIDKTDCVSSHVQEFQNLLNELEDGENEEEEYRIEGLYYHLCEKILDFPDWEGYDPYFCRVFDSYKVYWIPEEIKEISDQFK